MIGPHFDGLKISEPLNPHSLLVSNADTNFLSTPAEGKSHSGGRDISTLGTADSIIKPID